MYLFFLRSGCVLETSCALVGEKLAAIPTIFSFVFFFFLCLFFAIIS